MNSALTHADDHVVWMLGISKKQAWVIRQEMADEARILLRRVDAEMNR